MRNEATNGGGQIDLKGKRNLQKEYRILYKKGTKSQRWL